MKEKLQEKPPALKREHPALQNVTSLDFCGVIYFLIFVYFFSGLECVGQSFAYVAHFVFLRDVWIRTQRANVARRPTISRHLCPPGSGFRIRF